MLPAQLTAQHFASYPSQARRLGVQNLSLLQQLPIAFLPSLLRELIEYDSAFPEERAAMDGQLRTLSALSAPQLSQWFVGFTAIHLDAVLVASDWVGQPAHFTEDLSAYLWASHQMDAFRAAANLYSEHLKELTLPASLPAQRLGIAIIGQGVSSHDEPLFTNLRKHGTYFSKVNPKDGLTQLLSAMSSRAKAYASPYAHWYVDGGVSAPHDNSVTAISYASLAQVRTALLKNIEIELGKPGMGPEQLRSHLMRLSPADLDMHGDALLDRFQVKLLTEGSGTQIFSTTFVQWAAHEILRRAQPLSLMVRYAPRQRQRPMNELLASLQVNQQVDAAGSLIDGDMGAYYQWIDQQRLPQAQHSGFVAWFEDQSEAMVIGASVPRGVESKSNVDLRTLIDLALG